MGWSSKPSQATSVLVRSILRSVLRVSLDVVGVRVPNGDPLRLRSFSTLQSFPGPSERWSKKTAWLSKPELCPRGERLSEASPNPRSAQHFPTARTDPVQVGLLDSGPAEEEKQTASRSQRDPHTANSGTVNAESIH